MRLPWSRQRPRTALMPAPPQALTEGEIVGSYRVGKQLGEGGMGAVYAATHLHTGSKAVLKVLLPTLSLNPQIAQRFVNEARAASNLKHRNIVTVYDCAKRSDGQWYMPMEFLDGITLADFIERHRPLGLPTVVQIVVQIANALQAAHTGGIIHRDMKPENVFITAAPGNRHKVTVLDFGCAKFEEAAGVRTNTSAALGTPLYMPPEQFRVPKDIDRRADVYALGAITWEMVVGERLWNDCETIGEIISRQLVELARINPCSRIPSVPAEVGAVIARALARDPAQRWPTAQAYALALAAALPADEWGPDAGVELVKRYAVELTVASDADAVTEGRHLPPEMVRAAAPTLRAISDGAAPLPVVAAMTPPPVQAGRAAGVPTMPERPRAPTPVTVPHRLPGEVPIIEPSDAVPLRVSTLGAAVGQSEAHDAAPVAGVSRSGRRVVLGGAVAVALGGLAVVLMLGRDAGDAHGRSSATPSAASGSPLGSPVLETSSALAVVTEPAGAVVYVDGAPRGTSPVNVAATVGRTVEVRAELPGHETATRRVTLGPDPATVRLALAPMTDPAPPDAGTPVDASVRVDAGPPPRRDRRSPTVRQEFDPDGVLR